MTILWAPHDSIPGICKFCCQFKPEFDMWGLPHDTRKRFFVLQKRMSARAMPLDIIRLDVESPLQYTICLRAPRLLVHLFYPHKPRSLTLYTSLSCHCRFWIGTHSSYPAFTAKLFWALQMYWLQNATKQDKNTFLFRTRRQRCLKWALLGALTCAWERR